jgi:hypothetical protein
MHHFYRGPRPLLRWQLGLLFASLPRRLISSRLGDFLPGGADEPLPNPVGEAHPRELGRLPDQSVVLRQKPDAESGGVRPFKLRSSHAVIVGPRGTQVKRQTP